MKTRRALMALQFFPRGGSAQVVRNLAGVLPGAGWKASVLSGSVRGIGDARAFYRGLDLHVVDMTAALEAPDPVCAEVPLHSSYEDRPGAPDRLMASLDDAAYAHHVATWARALKAAGAAEADVLHLHHLAPLHEAAALVAPDVPVVGHLHGTELLMLEEGVRKAHLGEPAWRHFDAWWERMRGWAQRCERLILLSPSQVERAEILLDVDPDDCVCLPNGFDPALFRRMRVDREAVWRPYIPDYSAEFPVLLYVGRFTAVKRVPLLIEAYARARPGFVRRAPLVLLGGFPGEWEGEHPKQTIARTGARDVHLAGWHPHDALGRFFNASDVVVLPSVREQFGQVLVEGMACGLPAIAVDSHGPAEIVEHGETGWLVEGDDVVTLANALVEAVNRPGERRRRGANAHDDAQSRYAWPELSGAVSAVYEDVTALGEERGGLVAQA